jgi:hypothetical protein
MFRFALIESAFIAAKFNGTNHQFQFRKETETMSPENHCLNVTAKITIPHFNFELLLASFILLSRVSLLIFPHECQ